jgi:hypothetical protein
MPLQHLREWAVKGAEQRLLELAEEARAIFRAFPELRGRGRGFDAGQAGRRGRASGAADASQPSKRRRGGGTMSAAGRKAVSLRMKKYWAERRKKR